MGIAWDTSRALLSLRHMGHYGMALFFAMKAKASGGIAWSIPRCDTGYVPLVGWILFLYIYRFYEAFDDGLHVCMQS